jgi:hypothetical protein
VRRRALGLSAAAFAFSLFQLVVHSSLGLTAAAAVGVLYAWWAFCLSAAGRGEPSGFAGMLVLALGWSLIANGLVPLADCAPSCLGRPREEFIEIGNTVLGAAAAGATWPAVGRKRTLFGWSALVSVALTAVALAVKT